MKTFEYIYALGEKIERQKYDVSVKSGSQKTC